MLTIVYNVKNKGTACALQASGSLELFGVGKFLNDSIQLNMEYKSGGVRRKKDCEISCQYRQPVKTVFHFIEEMRL